MQFTALKELFVAAYNKDKSDAHAKELRKLFETKEFKALLLFMHPTLRDLRLITKAFQLKTGNNLDVYEQIKTFIKVKLHINFILTYNIKLPEGEIGF